MIFELERFVAAQEPVYDQVRAELGLGRKTSHWMWFIFPQLRGLGSSAFAVKYGIALREEAAAYLEHAVLGPRLLECTGLVLVAQGRTAQQIFGSPDDMKLHSCMTLFDAVSDGRGVFRNVLQQYFDGKADLRTLELL